MYGMPRICRRCDMEIYGSNAYVWGDGKSRCANCQRLRRLEAKFKLRAQQPTGPVPTFFDPVPVHPINHDACIPGETMCAECLVIWCEVVAELRMAS